jgi:hypothetical protein
VEIIDGRKCANTKIQYFRKVQHFKKWICDFQPMRVDSDGTLNLSSITTDHIQEFLGHICKKKKAGGG